MESAVIASSIFSDYSKKTPIFLVLSIKYLTFVNVF